MMRTSKRDWSGKRDSNSRPQPWQGADHALPTGCGNECVEILDWCTSRREIGAGNETRTRDPDLGKVVLYQLSYSRNRCLLQVIGAGNETRTRDPDLGKVVLYQLSYSRIGIIICSSLLIRIGAGNETRTRDPDLGKVVLYQLSYSRNRMSSASDWSGKRDSNSRPRPWQGRALPTELFPHRNNHLQ